MSSAVKKFNRAHMEESFEHARDLRFQEDIETKPSNEEEVSKTANMFGDFYFTAATASAKEMAAKVVNTELQDMRDKLSWGSLTPSKPIPKEEFQNQLAKSKFLSLFLVMRRVTGKLHLAQKKNAFKQWVEWLKAFMVLYRSRKHVRRARSRSSSPNSRSIGANSSDSMSVSTGYSSRSSHPRNYHFHGDRNMTPEQIRRELYLHKDVYLSSQDDADTARALLHRAHPHSSNHPEREFKEAVGQRQANKHAPVPSHVVMMPRKNTNPNARARSASPTRRTGASTLASNPASAVSAADQAHNNPNGYHFHGQSNLSPTQLRKELYLHTDLFLTSEDDVANALLHKNRPHSPNHPEMSAASKFASPKHRARASKSPAHIRPGTVGVGPGVNGGVNVGVAGRSGARSQSPPTNRKFSPHVLRRDMHLGHDMFLTSQDDDLAQLMLHKAAAKPRGVSCRALDVIVGSRKDAQIVHKSDPVSHVKKIASGQHHSASPSTPRALTPSKYASGITSSGLKAFNVSKDKKNDKPRRMSVSPTKVLSAEHAEVVGIVHAPEESQRPGTPSRALTRALSILITPTSDAVKLDHRVTAEHALKRTLSALTQAGHEDVVEAATRTDSQNDLELSDSEDEGLARKNSRIGGLDLIKGLSIRTTDLSVDGSVRSASPNRRNSFRSPTVSHILKVAHRSDSVEKVAAKVAEKRNSTRQPLAKAPHPSQVFEIIPEELVARRAERRTSFRSPTKSHEIKIAEKNGDEDAAELIAGHSRSDSAPERVRRSSFAGSIAGSVGSSANVREDGVIRTYIPFSKHASSAISPTGSVRSPYPTSPSAASLTSVGIAGNNTTSTAGSDANTLRRKGSLLPGGSPPLAKKNVGRKDTNTTLTSPTTTTASNGSTSRNSSTNNMRRKSSGNVKFGDDEGSIVDDDSSVGVYDVDDDLINLFDTSKVPHHHNTSDSGHANNPLRKRGSIVGNNHNANLNTKKTPPKYIIQTPRRGVPLQTEERDRKNSACNVLFIRFNAYNEKHGKTTSVGSAFNTWRVATGWFKRVSERIPQSILYLLQVEREILWRVFCVYCQDKQRIPVSPPVLAVTPVLSHDAVERLTSGYSAHHDHHSHAPAVLHPYHDIHTAPVHKNIDAKTLKRDLYLHHDIFLNTDDTDVTEFELHKARKHAANHPEEGIVLHHEHVKHEVEIVHHHDSNIVHPHQHEVNKKALQKDIHLKHDIFLNSNDNDVIETIVKHNHPHAMNHPEEGVIVDNGRIKRPPKLVIPSPQHSPVTTTNFSFNGTGSNNVSPAPKLHTGTPLYGLFTVIEDEHDAHDEDNTGATPPPKLNYGIGIAESDSPTLPVPDDHVSPHNNTTHTSINFSTNTTTAHTITHTTTTTTTTLEILVPTISNVKKDTAADIVARHASTRFKKKLLDVDGLWQLFLDFNVVPYLFNKVKLREMFDHSVTTAPLSPDPTVVAWENNPLQNLPAFNVYTRDAPEKNPNAVWNANPSPRNSPRVSPERVRSGSVGGSVGGGASNTTTPYKTPNSAVNTPFRTPNTTTPTPNTTTPNTTNTSTTTPNTTSPNPNRRPSAVSTASTASQRRMNRMLETLGTNGTRRAFTSPDGKVQIKLTAFSPPASITNSDTYIGNVTNPRSKSPAVVRVQQQKKKQEDDFAKAIVSANRKAAEDKALQEKTARAKNNKSLIKAPAMYKSVLSAENKLNGRANSPKRSPNKTTSGLFGTTNCSNLGELELFHVDLTSPGRATEMISFHSFVRLLWEVAASYMEIERDDEAGIAALKAFVFVLHRYHARMVTKEVEKVLPLLTHDQNIRHKALKLL